MPATPLAPALLLAPAVFLPAVAPVPASPPLPESLTELSFEPPPQLTAANTVQGTNSSQDSRLICMLSSEWLAKFNFLSASLNAHEFGKGLAYTEVSGLISIAE